MTIQKYAVGSPGQDYPRDQLQGNRCRHCLARNWAVVKTYKLAGQLTRRTCHCRNCKRTFDTIEFSEVAGRSYDWDRFSVTDR